MSHWSGESESASVAGEFGRSPGGGPEASEPSLETWSGESRLAKPAVDEAFSILLSLSRLARKLALFELATATPISSYA